ETGLCCGGEALGHRVGNRMARDDAAQHTGGMAAACREVAQVHEKMSRCEFRERKGDPRGACGSLGRGAGTRAGCLRRRSLPTGKSTFASCICCEFDMSTHLHCCLKDQDTRKQLEVDGLRKRVSQSVGIVRKALADLAASAELQQLHEGLALLNPD